MNAPITVDVLYSCPLHGHAVASGVPTPPPTGKCNVCHGDLDMQILNPGTQIISTMPLRELMSEDNVQAAANATAYAQEAEIRMLKAQLALANAELENERLMAKLAALPQHNPGNDTFD